MAEKPAIVIVPPDPADINSFPSRKKLTRRSRIRPASIFHPEDPTLPPELHFPLQTVRAPDRPVHPRFVNRFNSREILLVVDGSCINNGRHADKSSPPIGSASFKFKNSPGIPNAAVTLPLTKDGNGGRRAITGTIAFRLEEEGPRGDVMDHTSNRAKLRAVIAALQFRGWHGEGWRGVVVLTDLEYIVKGATEWLPRWVERRWRKSRARAGRGMGGRKYANRDLWEELQHRIEELRSMGCEVSFWLVRDGELIRQTKAAARMAAWEGKEEGLPVEKYTRLFGIMM
ncbi:putative ribonuclease H [Cercophora samala]|uniref:Ribonuclease H n=1 Tax=Cercophora samala TaxID=330535 RepID=A0AA39ZIW3_9PEZI|nr:putative ribonuclease H [Cercophora samala]